MTIIRTVSLNMRDGLNDNAQNEDHSYCFARYSLSGQYCRADETAEAPGSESHGYRHNGIIAWVINNQLARLIGLAINAEIVFA